MRRAARLSIRLSLTVAVLGCLAWRLWPDSTQARRQQRGLALAYAVQHDDVPAATCLLEVAAVNGDAEMVSVLLSRGANVNYRVRGLKWRAIDMAEGRRVLVPPAA